MTIYTAYAIVSGAQEATEEGQLEAWQLLVDTGTVWNMPGAFGRKAQEMIDAGLITLGLDPEPTA